MSTDLPDYYGILQVHLHAEQEVIDAAYRRLARKYHPDVNIAPDAAQIMAELNAAYEVLSNPEARATYDAARGQTRPSYESEQFYGTTTSTPPTLQKARWWRWLLILPLAVAGFFLAQLLALLVGILLPDKGSQLLSSFVTPMGFIIAGTWPAPARQKSVAEMLTVIMLVLNGMVWGIGMLTEAVAFLSLASLAGIAGSLAGLMLARVGRIRRKAGMAMLTLLSASKLVVGVIIFVGILVGIWWPIIQAIMESPLWALLLVPLGFLFSGLAWWIQTLLYNILVWPAILLTRWLLKEELRD